MMQSLRAWARQMENHSRLTLLLVYILVLTVVMCASLLQVFEVRSELALSRSTQPQSDSRDLSRLVARSLSMPAHVNAGDGTPRIVFSDKENIFESYSVILFPIIAYNFRIQRPQHLSNELGKSGHRVFYLDPVLVPSDEVKFKVTESPSPFVYLLQITCPGDIPNMYSGKLTHAQASHIFRVLSKVREVYNIRSLVSIIEFPFWHQVARMLQGSLMVYDCLDYMGGFDNTSPVALEQEEELTAEADLIITTSAPLSDIVLRLKGRNNTLIRNAADVEFFGRTPNFTDLAYPAKKRPIVGYIGAVAEWFDIELLAAAARAYSGWDFIVVGSTFGASIDGLSSLRNLFFLGEKEYKDLPGYLHSFDVAIIPFMNNQLTLCTNPVKVYEYLAAGKPVVATPLPELLPMAEHVLLANTTEEFIRFLQKAYSQKDDAALIAKRKTWAHQHSWANRARDLNVAISTFFAPLVSLIMLTYNQLTFTKHSLISVRKYTFYSNYELIIVDNGSDEETTEWLTNYAQRYADVRIIFNRHNIGFSAAVNIGLAAAKGDFLVVMNNDIFVTPGWLFDLLRHARLDPSRGVVGPVTNMAGNEAKLDIQYANMEDMLIVARDYTSNHPREFLETKVAAFFCVCITRDAYQKIGPMDEEFGKGYFEDDDYCNRARAAGFRTGVADDVFVHHHLSATFGSGAKLDQFTINKSIYTRKWGDWDPPKYRWQK